MKDQIFMIQNRIPFDPKSKTTQGTRNQINSSNNKKQQQGIEIFNNERFVMLNLKEVIRVYERKQELNTLIMSTGWITQVASIPDVPPLMNGFTVDQTPVDFGFSCAIVSDSHTHSFSL